MSDVDDDDDEEGDDDDDDDDEEEEDEDDDGDVDEEEMKRLALEREEAIRKDIERLRHIFMYIDTTSSRIQDTIEANDVITAQQVEIRELKHIIETQNKTIVAAGGDAKTAEDGSSSSSSGKDKETDKIGTGSRDGSRKTGKRGNAATTTATYDSSDQRERERDRDRSYGGRVGSGSSNYGGNGGGGGSDNGDGNDISWSQYENYNDAERADLLERAIEALTKANNSKPPPSAIRTHGNTSSSLPGSRRNGASPGRK